MDNAFFGNSGAEANEAAIKIARLHGHANNIELRFLGGQYDTNCWYVKAHQLASVSWQ
jgi:glutamate-1-semialdehyde aminotransferase